MTAGEQLIEQGFRQGMLEGRLDALRAMTNRLLTLRFGAVSTHTQERLQSATAEELEAWSERVVLASTLDEVFEHNNG